MKISIALATYNAEKYLQKQLDSFLTQSKLPDEVVISDDNSTDSTCSILEKFKSEAPFDVYLLNNQKKGFNKNFENALKNTTGDLVFISDQDDIWLENKIKVVCEYFVDSPGCNLIIHDLQFCDSVMNPINQTKIERIKSFNDSLNGYVTGMASSMRRDFLQSCLPLPNGLNYDSWIHACANLLNTKCISKKSLSLYRRHDNNATKGKLINAPYKTSFYHFFLEKILTSPSSGILYEKNTIESLLTYLEENVDFIKKYINNPKIGFLRKQLKKEKLTIEKRIKLQKKNRIKRIPLALKLFANGGYSKYSGIMSMLKDIIYS